jgi:succinate-semialdehyde dehydrogenase/glutarate-semialdehyde dehydrogenase
MDDLRTELSIDGSWRAAEIAVASPCRAATGDELASVADATSPTRWPPSPPRTRGRFLGGSPAAPALDVLRRAFELMLARADHLAELIVRENGKPIAEARGEVTYAAEFFRWFSEEAVRLHGRFTTAPGGGNHARDPSADRRRVADHAVELPRRDGDAQDRPGLAAGCTVVLKPATETPLTALAVAAILADAGVPAGVVNVVPTTRNADVVAAMLADPRVRKLSFTGSTEVGRLLLAEAARRVVKCSMELGGNAPFLVFADADLDAAIEGAMIAKMRHNGEACTAANRFYVERAVADEFSQRLATAMGGLKMGNGLDPAVRIGPLVNDETRARWRGSSSAARDAGAAVLTGGDPEDGAGFFYPPTVLVDVASSSPILAEEIFGPVAPVVAFDRVEDAIRMANATDQGLVSYVYTRDLARGLRVAAALEAGMIGLNRGLVSDPAAPVGGMKQSGIGREGGPEGILEYTETKYIAVNW